jgi:hypothetical protein
MGCLAPVIVAYRREQLVLEAGNHRVESLRRAGRRIGDRGVQSREDRDNFVLEWAPTSSAPAIASANFSRRDHSWTRRHRQN